MKVKIKSKRVVLKRIKQGNFNCITPEMIVMHCGKIAKVVEEHPYHYRVNFDDEFFDAAWCWPKWCCKIIKENTENERTN